ncbi:MAG: DUF3800 domain-containing protein [Actinomycetaceae bacterium]|nr:DUF3800 domain-containing protein [Actinomycetaceae bacterium]
MLIAYVDESFPQGQDFYFIGAAIAEQDAWNDLEDKFANLRSKFATLHGLPSEIEFHGHEIMGGAHEWKGLRGRHREAFSVYNEALRAVASADVSFLFKGLDVVRLAKRYSDPFPPYMVTMTFLLEKINEHARTQSPDECIVVADMNSLQDKFQKNFEDYKTRGTFGYKKSKLERLSSPLNFADSSTVIGLQAIDLALYVYQRCHCAPENEHPKARRSREKLWAIIEPNVTYQNIWYP